MSQFWHIPFPMKRVTTTDTDLLCDTYAHVAGASMISTTILTPRRQMSAIRIAVTYDNGLIFQHFGHTEQFKLYDIESGKVINSRVVDTLGEGHGALGGFLEALGVNVLICGGIGGGAQMTLAELGIQLLFFANSQCKTFNFIYFKF